MNLDTVSLVAPFLAGAMLGLFYFGGLWLTLRRIHCVTTPGLLLIASFAGRMAVVLPAFYYVMAGQWERVAACLVGFLVIRSVIIRQIRPLEMTRNTNGRMSP